MDLPKISQHPWLASTAAVLKRTLGWGTSAFVVYIAFILAYGTLTDWQPAAELAIESERPASSEMQVDSVLSFIIWNVGYGGLGAESNFFFDHGYHLLSRGKMIRAPRSVVAKNIEGMRNFVAQAETDFFLLQEVDFESRRSYRNNQYEILAEELSTFYAGYAPNYRVKRVPIPLLEPWRAYGHTNSGLATYARFQPANSERLQLPGAFGWPTRIFQLDRCVALHRFPLENNKQVVVINIHLSAYDADGSLKRQEMDYLQKLCLEEYGKGNYVVVGGDWNQCPPFFAYDTFMPGRDQGYSQINIDAEFLPSDWRWVYDPDWPTNRKVREVYSPGETFVTVIDFFLISPNVQVRSVRTINQEFQFSDHQPVWMEVELQ